MNEKKIDEVVTKTFLKFNVKTDFKTEVVTNLVQGQATSQLAYLQVYLDRLWKTAYQIKYAEKEWSDTPPPVQINKDNLEKVGNVNEVLELYLEDQMQEISKQLNKVPEIIRALLDNFVTEDGTKRPIDKSSQLLNPGKKLTENELKRCLQLLQEARLLRDDNQYYELAHDALAGILDGKRTAQQRFIKNLAYSLRTNFELYKKSKGGFLPEENVVLYDTYKESVDSELEQVQNKDQNGVQLKQEIIDYITASRTENEKERKELGAKNQRLRWLNRFIIILVLFITAIALGAVDLYKESQKNLKTANDNLNKYKREKVNQLILEAKTYAQSGDTADALENILKADSLLPNDPQVDSLILKYTPKIKP
jgi:hypothetical protein